MKDPEDTAHDRQEVSLIAGARPLFLIGSPRSGTTVLTRILNSHPRILLTNETAVFLQLDENIKKSREGVSAGILYGKQDHELWANHLLEQAPALIASYYEKIAANQRRKDLAYWGEKHPHLEACIDFVEELYPDALYVYAQRDPRDVACSIAEMNESSMTSAIDTAARFAERYEQFCAGLDAKRILRVSYEGLIHDYEGVTATLLGDLGLSLHADVSSWLEKHKSLDAHGSRSSKGDIDFRGKSYLRWKRDMRESDKAYARRRMSGVLEVCGYPEEDSELGCSRRSDSLVSDLPTDRVLHYVCNICVAANTAALATLGRENSSCSGCGSSVRLRSLIHLLSVAAYGKSLALPDFPVKPAFRGIDLSGWGGYARRLAHKMNYTNTFYHKEPVFDVTRPEASPYEDLDFVISSDVFEHVMQPVSRAFEGASEVLRAGGILILTVPYLNRIKKTVEHFPNLRDYRIGERRGEPILKNRLADGTEEIHRNLKFHGGPGATLEMRVFAREALLQELEDAGFADIEVHAELVPEYGIFWSGDFSLPISARKRGPGL